MKKSIAWILTLCLAITLCSFVPQAFADETEDPVWPEPGKKVTIIVNYAAGAQHDIMARTMAPYFAKYLGCDVDVEVHEGGSGLVGLKYMLEQHPEDGYTWVTWGAPKHDVESVIPSDGVGFYTLDDFKPLGCIQVEYHMIYVAADSPFNTINDLIDYAKEHPGELVYAGTGTYPGATGYVWEALQDLCGIEIQYVPFQGAAETIPAIMGGHADLGSLGAGDVYENYVKTGKVKALCTVRNERNPVAPDVPTFLEETGIALPEHVGVVHRPIMVSGYVPDYVYEKCCAAFKSVVEDPDFIEDYAKTGYTLLYVTPEEDRLMSESTAAFALERENAKG